MIVIVQKDGKNIELKQAPNNYVLQDGEVEKIFTQEEIDERNANELEQQNIQDVERQLSKANGIALAIFVFVRKDNVGLTDNQKSILMGLAVLLRNGNIEQAQADFNAITRPANANKMQRVYDRLKTEFDKL